MFSDEGADQRATIIELITKLRDYANDMQELILEGHTHGLVDDEDPDMIDEGEGNSKSMFSELFDIIQYLEELETLAQQQQRVEDSIEEWIWRPGRY